MRFHQFAIAIVIICVAGALKADDWPQWRGFNRDGISKETGLLKTWPKDGPKLLWKMKDMGSGYSTPSIAKGHIYLIGSPDNANEHVIAINEADRKIIWSTAIGKIGPNTGPPWPGTRSTPTVDGDKVYALGSDGDVACLDIAKGAIQWKMSMRSDLGGSPGKWAYAESLLVDGDVVVCSPGGKKATMVGLNKTDGKTVWECPIPEGDLAGYSSVVIGEVGGVRQYIQFLGKGVVGIEAKTGKFLWRYNNTSNGSMNITTPIFHDGHVFSTSTSKGPGLVKLTAAGDKITADQVYLTDDLHNHHGGVVLVGGYVYGTSAGKLVCVDYKTGAAKWSDTSVGKGSICYADGCLYVRAEKDGAMALVEATPDDYREKGRFTPPGSTSKKSSVWPHPIIANGRLYLRDQDTLFCYDVKK